MSRLPTEIFNLPVTEIRRGYRSAVYFGRTKRILERYAPDEIVTIQVFQKNNSIVCGLDHAIAVLRTSAGRYSDNDKAFKVFDDYMIARNQQGRAYSNQMFAMAHEYGTAKVAFEEQLNDLWIPGWDQLEVLALWDGDQIEPWEPVLQITGPLSLVVHLESVYLGLLARATKIATNVRRVVDAACGKPVLFFADRFDHYATQGGDGYAAHIGGASDVASDAMGNWWGRDGVGTMPHALIAAFGGDVVAASSAFYEVFPEAKLISLVDFNNDCVADALSCAEEFGDALWGVRLDTSENMVDMTLADEFISGETYPSVGDFKPTGVNPRLVQYVRNALDEEGYEHVNIVVSGGFNPDKIAAFEAADVPVDAYAVGSSLLSGSNDFTADVVRPVAKMGRRFRDDSRLERVK